MKKALAAIMVIASLFNGNFAYADDWYFGIGTGQSKLEEDTASGPDISTDDGDSALRIFAGLNFSEYLGLEFGYLDLGEVYNQKIFYPGFSEPDSFALSINGFYADGVASLPLGEKLALIGQVGLYAWSADADWIFYPTPAVREADSASDSDIGYSYGFGLAVNLSSSTGLKFMYEKFSIKEIEDDAFGIPLEYDAETSLISASFKYQF